MRLLDCCTRGMRTNAVWLGGWAQTTFMPCAWRVSTCWKSSSTAPSSASTGPRPCCLSSPSTRTRGGCLEWARAVRVQDPWAHRQRSSCAVRYCCSDSRSISTTTIPLFSKGYVSMMIKHAHTSRSRFFNTRTCCESHSQIRKPRRRRALFSVPGGVVSSRPLENSG